MATRTLLVEIIGDEAGLSRSLKNAGDATSGFGSKLGTLAKTAALALGAAALGGIALVLDKSVKAALAGQVSQAKLDAALKATHQSAAAMAPALDDAEAASRRLGFSDDDTRESLSKLEIATGSTTQSVKDLSVAQDLARFKHIDLTAATQTLAQAMTGSQRAIKQLGINIPPVTTNYDALKLSGEKLTTAQGMLDSAHAKLADKMATSRDIIQAVTDKVKGQADAFSGTAAGGMAQFQAQLSHIEEAIGNALLPILESAVNWVNANWPQIQQVFQTVFGAIGTAVDAAKPYFDMLVQWVSAAVGYVRANWPQISAVITQVMNAVGSIIQSVVTVVKAIWAQFGDTILTVIQRSVNAVISVVKDLYNEFLGIVNLISDLIHGKWSAVWDDLKRIVSAAFNALVTIISTVVSNTVDEAVALGKAIVQGIVKGLAALGRLVLQGLAAIAVGIANAVGDLVGDAIQLGQALVNGVISGIESLAKKIADAFVGVLKGALNIGKSILGINSPSKVTSDEIGAPMGQGVVEGWLLGTATLPSTMSQSMQTAIAAAQRVVQGAQSGFQSAFSGFSSIADQMFSGVTQNMQTKAGAALAKLTAKHDTQQLKQAVTGARSDLATAQAGGDPATILAAQQALNEALYQQKVASLTKQAAAEQKQLNATNAVRQISFDKSLQQLEDNLAKGHTSTKEAMDEMTALLKKYGVTFGSVGSAMGTAWVQGLKDAILEAARSGGDLKKILQQEADGIKVPHLSTGGYIAQSGIAVVHAGEHVVPAGGSMKNGGNTYSVTVNSIDPRTAATAVVEAINNYERTNGPRFARA